ncbi:sigma-70 family RNA polymerase sigma factor [Neobacillus drentensis]|uniref:sigma-70 family RNA polymerase sigma factor n=1 Tax=Neobacillus drentensis TaxID=220684 RepID=UPI002FFFD2D0
MENDVVLAQQGDKKAFIRIIKSVEKSLYYVAKSMLTADSDCMDAAQEAILKAYQPIAALKEPKYFKTWITRILINECHNILRKNKKIVMMDDIREQAIEHKMGDFVDLENAMELLEENYKVVITLHYINDLSIQEISTMLGIPEGTVKSRLNRARKKLGTLLDVDHEEGRVQL